MSRRSLSIFLVAIFLGGAVSAMASHVPGTFGKLPLTFEANEGQVDPAVRFLTRGSRYTMFLTPAETVLSLRADEQRAVVRWQMNGANRNPRIAGEALLETKSNDFRGNDKTKWRTGVANYAQVRYEGVYPGIDVVYRGNERQVEYDFVIAPKANPKQIRLAFDGIESMKIGAQGELILRTSIGDLVQPRPTVYQEIGGRRRSADEIAYGIATDSSGNCYVASGTTGSLPFVTAGAIQSSHAGNGDAFAIKIDSSGAKVWATYLGGSAGDGAGAVTADSSGNAWISGGTSSTDFPGVTAALCNRPTPGTATASSPRSTREERLSSTPPTSAAAAASEEGISPSTVPETFISPEIPVRPTSRV